MIIDFADELKIFLFVIFTVNFKFLITIVVVVEFVVLSFVVVKKQTEEIQQKLIAIFLC